MLWDSNVIWVALVAGGGGEGGEECREGAVNTMRTKNFFVAELCSCAFPTYLHFAASCFPGPGSEEQWLRSNAGRKGRAKNRSLEG